MRDRGMKLVAANITYHNGMLMLREMLTPELTEIRYGRIYWPCK